MYVHVLEEQVLLAGIAGLPTKTVSDFRHEELKGRSISCQGLSTNILKRDWYQFGQNFCPLLVGTSTTQWPSGSSLAIATPINRSEWTLTTYLHKVRFAQNICKYIHQKLLTCEFLTIAQSLEPNSPLNRQSPVTVRLPHFILQNEKLS